MGRLSATTEQGGTIPLDGLADFAGRFGAIYTDPPWSYDNGGNQGGVNAQYQTMPLEDIGDLPVGELASADGCHLWMWTTWPMLRDGAPQYLLDRWGFTWKSELVWDKQFFGIGYWLKKQTEILILGVKGGKRIRTNTSRDFASIPRARHSEKPHQFYDLIEKESDGPYLEMFARSEAGTLDLGIRPHWWKWGNQA